MAPISSLLLTKKIVHRQLSRVFGCHVHNTTYIFINTSNSPGTSFCDGPVISFVKVWCFVCMPLKLSTE